MKIPPIFGSPLVTNAARKLIATVAAVTREEAEERFEEFLEEADESGEGLDAAFLAAQMLRDLDLIDPEEAVLIFAQLLSLDTDTLEELTPDAIEYCRAHGEGAVATAIVDDPATYRILLKDADRSLFSNKFTEDVDSPPADDPASIAVVAERVLTLSASSAGPEREAAWGPLRESMKEVSIEARVSALRRLRDVGALTSAEHAALIDRILWNRSADAISCDREMQRRQRSSGLDAGETPSPFERREREKPLHPRGWRVRAACLRQVGEHDLANLYLADSGVSYRKLVDAGDASMPVAAHPERARINAEWEAAGKPTDDDLDLVVDYWDRLMSDEESVAFEDRIRDEEGLFMRVARLMDDYMNDKPLPRSLKRRLALRRAMRRMERDQVARPAKRAAPDEAEVELVRQYIDDELNRRDEEFFEARLLVDLAFYHRVAPYVRAWLSVEPQDPALKRIKRIKPTLYAAIMAVPLRGDIERAQGEDLGLFAHYWAGVLEDDEMSAFEDRMATDAAFLSKMARMLRSLLHRPAVMIEIEERIKDGPAIGQLPSQPSIAPVGWHSRHIDERPD